MRTLRLEGYTLWRQSVIKGFVVEDANIFSWPASEASAHVHSPESVERGKSTGTYLSSVPPKEAQGYAQTTRRKCHVSACT